MVSGVVFDGVASGPHIERQGPEASSQHRVPGMTVGSTVTPISLDLYIAVDI